jgi:phosphotriesterase-related protein
MTLHNILGIDKNIKGYVLSHEHIFCDFTGVTGDSDHLLNDKAVALRELAYFANIGGVAIVDITPTDLGRQPQLLVDIASKTELSIIMATGWYRKAFYPPEIDITSSKALSEIMISELTRGIDLPSGDRAIAGIIGEIGVDRDLVSAQEERVLRAAAMAALETGAPISTHSSMYPVGLQQLEILRQYPLESNKIIIGHADTYLDADYHKKIVDAGCYIQFDTIGRSHMNSDHDRISAIMYLIENGYQKQLLLSTDRCFRSDLKTFGGLGYDYLFTNFKKLLGEAGLGSDKFDQITKENPIMALSW